MSRVVLELNDHALRLYDEDGLQVSSPGYALAIGNNVHFGQQAVEQSRLHPVTTNNEFWHRLSMEPLARPLAHYRHYADLAYGHLMSVAEQSGYKGSVILAVPGSYSRQQLAVLSGVLQHSPFRADALVDAGLLAVLSQLPGAEKLVYVDLQLHQLTLASFYREPSGDHRERGGGRRAGGGGHRVGGEWCRGAVQSVQSAGWHNLANTMVQVINDAFVAQCRFNPQHNAMWEQHLYNELPQLLAQIKTGQQVVAVTIETDQGSHEARVGREDLSAELEPVFRKMAQQLKMLAPEGTELVLVSERAALVPGLVEWLGAGTIAVAGAPVSSEQMAAAGLRLDIGVAGDARQVPYVTRMAEHKAAQQPVHQAEPQPTQQPTQQPMPQPAPQSTQEDSAPAVATPTHILLGDQARRLQDRMVLAATADGPSLQSQLGPDSLCEIRQDQTGVTIAPVVGVTLRINGEPLTRVANVRSGDILDGGADVGSVRFIQVISE